MTPQTPQMNPPEADSARLIEWLADRNVQCPLCGYNLRALTTPRCPECGEELQLSVALIEPYLKAWIACAAGVLAHAGIGVLFALLILVKGWPRFQPLPSYIAVVLAMAMIPAALMTVIMRRRYLRLERGRQRILAGLSLGVLIINLALFFSYLH